MVDSFKYLGKIRNKTGDEIEYIKDRIAVANRVCCSFQQIYKSEGIERNKK
jgi:ASC-1-like (ASCH) protein